MSSALVYIVVDPVDAAEFMREWEVRDIGVSGPDDPTAYRGDQSARYGSPEFHLMISRRKEPPHGDVAPGMGS